MKDKEKTVSTYQIKYVDPDKTWITELIEADEIWTPNGFFQFRRDNKTLFKINATMVHNIRNVSELDMKV